MKGCTRGTKKRKRKKCLVYEEAVSEERSCVHSYRLRCEIINDLIAVTIKFLSYESDAELYEVLLNCDIKQI